MGNSQDFRFLTFNGYISQNSRAATTECFYGREFNSREEIVDAVRDYLDYYNHRRIQLKLKELSPIQYRKQSFKHTFLYQLLTTLFTYYSHSILYYFPK